MASSEVKKIAENFLKDQAKIIQKYGHTPKLSGDRYKQVMDDTKKTFEMLKAAASKSR